jgi:hypothetical protein
MTMIKLEYIVVKYDQTRFFAWNCGFALANGWAALDRDGFQPNFG